MAEGRILRVAISLTLVFVAATSALGVAANVRRIKRDLSFGGYFLARRSVRA